MSRVAPDARDSAVVPLSRNRHYNILWSAQLLSELAVEVVAIAIPLLVLAKSGSPWQLGLAAALMAAASLVAAVPAGVVADRWDRRRVMLVCQMGRIAAVTSLVVVLLLDAYSYPHLLVVVVVEGVLGSVFDPAEHAALPQVVPASQLSAAIARNTSRPYVATLLGPALAGLLFALHPVHAFTADAAMLLIAFTALLFLRLPARRPVPPAEDDGEDEPGGGAGGELVEGLRWVLRNKVIRTTLIWVTATNLFFSALVVLVLVMSGEDGVGAAELGLTMTCFGAGGLLGGLFAARLHDRLPPPVVVLGFSWTVVATTAAMSVVPSGLPLGVLLGVGAFLAPVANTTVLTYQVITTPDRLRGRLSGVVGLCAGGAGVLGPLVGGVLMSATGGGSVAVAMCAAAFALIALGTTLSPTLRRFPAPGRSTTTDRQVQAAEETR